MEYPKGIVSRKNKISKVLPNLKTKPLLKVK
jgi:hypothetical protein